MPNSKEEFSSKNPWLMYMHPTESDTLGLERSGIEDLPFSISYWLLASCTAFNVSCF